VKVLLMAYECSPWRGSEWAVGWGRLLQAARGAEPHVITSEENFRALELARAEGLLPANVRFYTPEPDAKLREMEKKPALFAYNYSAYHHWQKLAFELARELHVRAFRSRAPGERLYLPRTRLYVAAWNSVCVGAGGRFAKFSGAIPHYAAVY